MHGVEFVIVGAGPGGLCAAHVLASAGREVLVLERNEEVGPKTCAGGLSRKAVALLEAMGLPPTLGKTHLAHASFLGEDACPLDRSLGVVRTIPRRVLGRWQAEVTRQAGATIRTGAPVTAIDLGEQCVTIAGREKVRYSHLIGADGSHSLVRRALGLPCPRRFFAAEYNIPDVQAQRMLVRFDVNRLKGGYFWVFPHAGYTSFGCGADRTLVPPRAICRYLSEALADAGIPPDGARLEACPIECEYAGVDFGSVHLVGDAAGLASPLSGEGIYAALASGMDVALSALCGTHKLRLRRWLRTRALHARLAELWRHDAPRLLSLWWMRALCRQPLGRRLVTRFFLA